ncbi:Hypothetical predicted protein [Mytilus galloprovincialis]|uniref:Peptidase A2 domain-containing protein n=1 Tax=Mytilus galloprovincialis TaxID=29158 RepID=A0A8B6FEW5_MYTGA|nr:Hypothetical predicted protein [Mytilus galloprovincialis]
METVRQLATSFRKPDNQSVQNEIRELRDLLERSMLKDSKPTSSTTHPIRRRESGIDRERRPVYKIGRGQGLFIPIEVNSKKVDVIVDTGADVTVLSRSFANDIGLSGTTGMKACLLNAESWKEMEADMNVVAKLRRGKNEIIWQVCIAPIRNDILIGMDLLKEVDGIIMARQGDLLIKDELIPGRYRKETDYQISRPKSHGCNGNHFGAHGREQCDCRG